MTHVGGSASHVESDETVVTRRTGARHHADDAARRTGENGILALESIRFDEAARALHEQQPHTRHLLRNLIHVAA